MIKMQGKSILTSNNWKERRISKMIFLWNWTRITFTVQFFLYKCEKYTNSSCDRSKIKSYYLFIYSYICTYFKKQTGINTNRSVFSFSNFIQSCLKWAFGTWPRIQHEFLFQPIQSGLRVEGIHMIRCRAIQQCMNIWYQHLPLPNHHFRLKFVIV